MYSFKKMIRGFKFVNKVQPKYNDLWNSRVFVDKLSILLIAPILRFVEFLFYCFVIYGKYTIVFYIFLISKVVRVWRLTK